MSILSLLRSHAVTVKYLNPNVSGTQIVEPFVNRSTGNAARIVPAGGSRTRTLLGGFPTSTHALYLLASVTIKPGDRVVDEATNEVYDVLSAPGPFFNRSVAHHRECVLQLLEVS